MPYKDKERQLEAQKEAYRKNPDPYNFRQAERRKAARDYIWAIKCKSKCLKCGEDHPATLDFHHRDPTQKEITAVKMVANKYSEKRINEELEKCDILCSNCHRILHHEIGY
jgi:hypothetical protein